MTQRDLAALTASLLESGFGPDDLAGFESPAKPSAPSIAAPSADSEILLHAALTGSFLPDQLSHQLSAPSGSPEFDVLLSASETIASPAGRAWRLRADVRQRTLVSAAASGTLEQALERLEPSDRDPTGKMLRRVLAGETIDIAKIPLHELDRFAQVVEWLAETELGAGLPDLAEVRRVQRRRELIEPFLTLVGRPLDRADDASRDRFVGREAEMERLRAYVGVMPPDKMIDLLKRGLSNLWSVLGVSRGLNEPLRIEGSGGAGKSTLIAKFILDHAMIPGIRLPFMYLDFDRATITPREPLQLLIDIALQLAIWLPEADSPLREFRHELRRRIEQQGRSLEQKNREQSTRSELRGLCERLRSIVEEVNQGTAPVILLIDTFELVQYSAEAVEGVAAFIQALRHPEGGSWPNLRVVVAGRGSLENDIETTQPPLRLGPLSLRATEKLIARRNVLDGLGLESAEIAALARPLSNCPLDVVIVTRWLKQNPGKAKELVRDILKDAEAGAKSGPHAEQGIVQARVTALLMNRMIEHIADRKVRALATPGFVVRAISADVIRDVMLPAAGDIGKKANDARAKDLYRRLEHERWLVSRQGELLRHRPEVRRAMLQLLRDKDHAAFNRTNERAIEFFEKRLDDRESRAEAIYHHLLADYPEPQELAAALEVADRLWRPECSRILASAVDDLQGLARDYLRARLGRDYSPDTLLQLPTQVLQAILSSNGTRILRRLAPDEFLRVLAARPEAAREARESGTEAEALYRGGRWSSFAKIAKAEMGELSRWAKSADESAGPLPDGSHRLRQLIALGTRDGSLETAWQGEMGWLCDWAQRANDIMFWETASFVAIWSRRTLNRVYWDMMSEAVARRDPRPARLDRQVRGSAAMRILALLEPPEQTAYLRCVDLKAHLTTINALEFALLQEMLSYRLDPAGEDTSVETQWAFQGAVDRGWRLVSEIQALDDGRIVLDPRLTGDLGTIAQTLLELAEPGIAGPARHILALTHPDWLEPLGLALSRAYDGDVPTKLGWFSSVQSLLGQETGGGRTGKGMTGHQILALADEAGQLQEAVAAYREHASSRGQSPDDFLYLADRLQDWLAMVHAQGPAAL